MLAISKSPDCSFSTLLSDLFESASSVVCLEIAFGDLLALPVAEASAFEIGDDFLVTGLFSSLRSALIKLGFSRLQLVRPLVGFTKGPLLPRAQTFTPTFQ